MERSRLTATRRAERIPSQVSGTGPLLQRRRLLQRRHPRSRLHTRWDHWRFRITTSSDGSRRYRHRQLSNRRSSTTDSNGYYSIPALRAGAVSVTVSATGYQTLTRSVTLTADTNFGMSLAPNAAPPPGLPASCNLGPYKWDSNPNVQRCRASNGQFAPSVCCGR